MHLQCTAHSKRSGQQCQNPPVRGRGTCRMHGGHQPRGIASPHWKGRGYSKDLPTRLADRYRAALADPDLIVCASEVALVDARIGEILAALPADRSAVDRDAWELLLPLIEQRRKLAETERRRVEALSGYLTTGQAMAFVAALQTAVSELVTDRATRAELGRRVEVLLARRVEGDGDAD
jgi:hypothetical protein